MEAAERAGDVVLVRFADDYVVGFQHREDAEQFLAELRDRFAKFGLELNAEKTRLIRFGRFAAQTREQRDLGKPETFDFLGFTHICGKTKSGSFALRRITIAKRKRTKLRRVKEELTYRRFRPIPEQGQWLASVVRGHCAYYAVPGNYDAVDAFRAEVTKLWYRALRRRSQRTTITWERMSRIQARGSRQPRSCIPGPMCALTPKPKAGAPYGSCMRGSARGQPEPTRRRAVPTAIDRSGLSGSFSTRLTTELVLKAVAAHTDERWILLYVERWLKAPLQREDGTLVERDRGTPQGSAISPCSQTSSCTTRSMRGWPGSSRTSRLSATATTSSSTSKRAAGPAAAGHDRCAAGGVRA